MITRVILYGLMAVLAIPFVYPTLWMILSAFKPTNEIFATPPTLLPRQWTLDGVSRIFTANPFAQQYVNSLYLSVIITASTIILGSAAGYAFARIRFPFAGKLFLILIATMFLPGEVTIIPIFRWVNQLGLMDTHLPLILIAIFGPGSVLATFIFRQFFLSLPVELEEAGRLDGLGRVSIYWRIAMPLAGPATAAVAIMTFLNAFNIYFTALIFLKTPALFPVGLGLTRYQDGYGEPLYNTQLGATTLAVLPVLIVFLFAQRHFVEGLSRTALKG